MGIYLHKTGAAAESLVHHLTLVTGLILPLFLLRVVARHSTIGLSVVWAISSALFATMCAYYALLLIGLSAWNGVPTWSMMAGYLGHWRRLFETLGMPAGPVFSALVVACVVIGWVFWLLMRRATWLGLFSSLSPAILGCLLAGALMNFGYRGYALAEGIYGYSGEPLSLTFHPKIAAASRRLIYREVQGINDTVARAEATAYRPARLETGNKRNVVLIVGDALRPDRMSVLGYSRTTTPTLEAARADGRLALATSAYSACAESLCGLMAIGQSKAVHETSRNALNLAQTLKLNGYQTAMLLSGDHKNFYDLLQWIGPADTLWDGTSEPGDPNDDRRLVERVKRLEPWDGVPTFMQLHLMSTHAIGTRHVSAFQPSEGIYSKNLLKASDAERKAAWGNYYDNGVLQFDAMLGQILEALEAKDYLRDALVVITSDHGEALGEHGKTSHGNSLHQYEVMTPLILLRYGHTGREIQKTRELASIDIAPTILDEVGLLSPAHWAGLSLHSKARRDFIQLLQEREIGLIDTRDPDAPWKYWTNRSTGVERAFDLSRDPAESHDAIAAVPEAKRSEWQQAAKPMWLAVPK
jgi:glucan phosphoethanolaminetransferase (alkaline phosphatase superfamily)